MGFQKPVRLVKELTKYLVAKNKIAKHIKLSNKALADFDIKTTVIFGANIVKSVYQTDKRHFLKNGVFRRLIS